MTPINPSLLEGLTIAQILNRHPLTVSPDMTVAEVVKRMGHHSSQDGQPSQAEVEGPDERSPQSTGQPFQTTVERPDERSASHPNKPHQSSCAVVLENDQFLGIFTEQDLVRLVADGVDLEKVAIAQVISQPGRSLHYAEHPTLVSALSAFNDHQLQPLPVLDQNGQFAGIITQTHLLELLDPGSMLEAIEQLQRLHQAQTLKLNEAKQQVQDTNEKLQTSLAEQERLETILLRANQQLEEKMGIQAAQLVQIDEKLQTEIQDRHQAQIQLEQFFTLTPSFLCMAGLDGYFQRINSKFTEILGYTEAELMADSFIHFVHPEDQAATIREVERLGQGELTIAFLNRYRCRDGSYRWLSWNATANLEEQIIYAAARDVTQQRQAEQALARQYQQQQRLADELEQQVERRTTQLRQINTQLEREITERVKTEIELRENQQRLSGILDNADEGIISIDQNQQIVLYNQGAEKIFGYRADEAMGQSIDLLLPNAFHRVHRQHVQTFAKAPESARQMAERNTNVLGRRKSGEEFPAEASIAKLQTKQGYLFTVMLKDITERQQAEDALRRSEEQLRLTTDALPVLICYVDKDQRYRFLNQTYTDWFQRPVAEICGQFIGDVIGTDPYERARSHIEAALAGERVHYEISRITPDGKVRDLDITYIPDVDTDGTVNGFFSLINDISVRKATERLKDEFVSVVGHELRTPLTSIHGSLKLLATKRLGTLAPQGQTVVDIALKNTERLTRLINDVLDLERIESGRITMNLQDCELSHLMTQSIQSMQAMANEYNVQLLTEPLEHILWADPDHVTQVLTNLLSNAIKFSTPEGTVWLRAIAQKQATVISVQDQGRGIPPDKIDTIFERFQQVDASDSRQRGGTGLGLTICQQIVQQHNGRIWVESTVGEGSTFFFSIPHKR